LFLHEREHVAGQILQVREGSAPVLFFRASGEFDAFGRQAIVLFLDIIDHEGPRIDRPISILVPQMARRQKRRQPLVCE
jgi:hypothetical protein